MSPNSLRTPSAGDDTIFLSDDIGLNPSFNSLIKKLLKEVYLLISVSLASLMSILNFLWLNLLGSFLDVYFLILLIY